MSIDETFNEAMSLGLLGQNITSEENKVWITKTHYPMDIPESRPFHANKMIVMARNPIDVIPSFANLFLTESHSLEVNESYCVDFPEYWNEWVALFVKNM